GRRVPGGPTAAPASDELGLGRSSNRAAGLDHGGDHADTRAGRHRAPAPAHRSPQRERTAQPYGGLEELHRSPGGNRRWTRQATCAVMDGVRCVVVTLVSLALMSCSAAVSARPPLTLLSFSSPDAAPTATPF